MTFLPLDKFFFIRVNTRGKVFPPFRLVQRNDSGRDDVDADDDVLHDEAHHEIYPPVTCEW